MESDYPQVFSPVRLGPIEVKNRIYFSPHGTTLSQAVSDDCAYYYAERAAGGVGLIIHSIPGTRHPYEKESRDSLAAVADLVHQNGAKIFCQVSYWAEVPGLWEFNGPTRPHLAPSDNQRFGNYDVARALTQAEIRKYLERYGQGITHLRQAGYDGVEVHCTHGVLIEQFLSPYWNRRTDAYGGDPDRRMRFLTESLEVARDNAGADMAVGLRFNCNEMLRGGLTPDDSKAILRKVAASGLVDFVDLDIAVEPNQLALGVPNYQFPKFPYESYVAETRPAAGSVVVLSALGRVTSVAEAERAITEGTADMIGMARGLIAEPELVNNARHGNEHRSRTCIACNYCLDETMRGRFGCAINPASGRERRWGVRALVPATTSRRVVVVGGGPAGLESARVAATRGHKVVLLERNEQLGGQYVLWSRLPGREGFYDAISWYPTQLDELGVEVRLGVEATSQMVLDEAPDCVIVATGSRYASNGLSGFLLAPIPGWDEKYVYTPERVLEDGARPGGKVVVLDEEGLNTGVGVAEILASAGAQVELVTRWFNVAHNLLGTLEMPMIVAQLKNLGVRLTPQTYIKEISNHQVTLFDVLTNTEEVRTQVDAVVLVTMRAPLTSLAVELEGKVDQLFTIGDAAGPRDHGAAFYEGALFARFIGEPGAPATFFDAFYDLGIDDPRPASTLSNEGQLSGVS